MTWTDKLEELITKSEFLFLENPIDVEGLLKYKHAQELATYLGLESMELTHIQQSWTITLFLRVLASYSKGDRLSQNQLLSLMSSGIKDLAFINEAIKVLEIKQIIVKKVMRPRPKQEILLEVVPSIMEKIMNQLPLPKYSPDEIGSKILLVFLRDNGIEIKDYYLKEAKDIIDAFLKTYKLRFIQKLNQYKSIKGDSKYLMILLIAKYYSDRGISKELSKGAVSLKLTTNPFNIKLSQEATRLHQLGLIETDYYEFIQEILVSISTKAMDKLGLEKKKNTVNEKTGGGSDLTPFNNDPPEMDFFKLIPQKEIEEEDLYYNQRLRNDLDFYKNLFQKEDKIFKKNPAIKGRIILMFDGLPGTGKTAAAQQLARQSNRDIVHVNWQTFRGQWVGQSEKNLKSMLDQVDELAMKSKRVPIVLFNEAEAFLSQRIAINQSTDRMENNLVSMLLEWLEKKNPFCIVVFTSNHRQLMDKAFERRISHVTFDAPDQNTRCEIWESLSLETNISKRDCKELSHYPLTGAEIVQVLRTYNLHQIAYEIQSGDINLWHRLCNSQKWMEQKATIGFKNNE